MSVYNVRARNRKSARRSMHCRAWLNGIEVTERCFYADPRRGVVRLFLLDVDAKKYVNRATGEVAWAEFSGQVVVIRKR